MTRMKKMLISIFIFLFGLFSGIFVKNLLDEFSYYPELVVRGYMNNGLINQIDVVPNEKTALRIATAVWLPLYGKRNLLGYSYKTKLVDEKMWAVVGSKKIYHFLGITTGGGPYIEIDKKTGLVLNVGHYGVVLNYQPEVPANSK